MSKMFLIDRKTGGAVNKKDVKIDYGDLELQ